MYSGGEVPAARMEIDEDLQNDFWLFACSANIEVRTGLELCQACRASPASALPTHSIVCAKLSAFNLKSIHFSFLSKLSIVSIFIAGLIHEFVAVQCPFPSSLALETSYENDIHLLRPSTPMMPPYRAANTRTPIQYFPLNRWIALTCSHRSSPQLNTDRRLADLRERGATHGASRCFCFPLSICLDSSQRVANWQVSWPPKMTDGFKEAQLEACKGGARDSLFS